MAEEKQFRRFSVAQIAEHWVLFVAFSMLALTGLPQKFVGNGWAEAMIGFMGGIETVRTLHHLAAVVMALGTVYHVVVVAYKVFVLRVRWTMFPRLDDALDALDAIRYNLGLTKEHPKLDRYGFAEKAEYWAMVWGTLIMGLTGFIMWNPINAARFLPGEAIPASKAAHGAEAILAVLAIFVWHFYNVHIKTLNKAVFTGKLSEHQMKEEHALELERIRQGKVDPRPLPEVLQNRQRVFIPIAALAAVVMFIGVMLLAFYENTAITPDWTARRARAQVFAPITPTPETKGPAATGVPVSADPLPASHAGRTTCVGCHANLPKPAMPADHAGRSDTTCSACHKTGGAPSATSAPAATPLPASSSSGTASPLPASHAGRTTCMACHQNLTQPAMPADHKGREDSTCAACHKAGSESAPTKAAPTSATAPAATKASATTAPAATSTTAGGTTSTGGPKPLPASHAGRTTCNACHTNNIGPANPADHAGRQDATCSACHKP